MSFILDCMDGKLARLTGNGSEFGGWLDYVFDRIRVLVCAIALMGGQYAKTGNVAYLWMSLAVVFLDMLRYIDALQIFKVRHSMRKQIRARLKAARRSEEEPAPAFMEDLLRENPHAENETVQSIQEAQETEETQKAEGKKRPVVDLHVEFKSRFPRYGRFRDFLLRHRVRTHLVSGIEFQMAVIIVGPVVGAVLPVTIAAGALLLAFELAIIYKLLLSTKDFERTLASIPAPEPAGDPVTIPSQPDAPRVETLTNQG